MAYFETIEATSIKPPVFSINDIVYHRTPESGKGIIVDINYSLLTNLYKYNVVFGYKPDDDVWCFGHELSFDKCL